MRNNGSSEPDMDERNEIAQQLKTELDILLGIEQSLRLALQWMTRGRGNGHKLSTLRFTARSFERHLTRTRILADQGGYLEAITGANPQLASDVSSLRAGRSELQDSFERIVLRLEYVSPDDATGFREICAELEGYLVKLEEHGHREMELLQQSFARDDGGEG